MTADHEYDDFRFFDGETQEWGYRRFCINPDHEHRECPMEGELFRFTAEATKEEA